MTAVLGTDKEVYDGMGIERAALRRLGEGIEIARVVVFLLSEQASYITSAVSRALTVTPQLAHCPN